MLKKKKKKGERVFGTGRAAKSARLFSQMLFTTALSGRLTSPLQPQQPCAECNKMDIISPLRGDEYRGTARTAWWQNDAHPCLSGDGDNEDERRSKMVFKVNIAANRPTYTHLHKHTRTDASSLCDFASETQRWRCVAAPNTPSCDPNNITDEPRRRRLWFELFYNLLPDSWRGLVFCATFETPALLAGENHQSQLIKKTKHLLMVPDKQDARRKMNVFIFDKLDFSFGTLLLKIIYKVKAAANTLSIYYI